jgi:DNA adenine methylase
MIKPILKYPGAKWRLSAWITRYFPEHTHYLEPYCGSADVFFSKTPAAHEVLNDINSSIVNLFRVMRSRPDELAYAIEMTPWSEEEYHIAEFGYVVEDELEHARRFLVRCWQAHGTPIGKKSGFRHNGINGGHAYPARLWKQLPDRLLATVDRLKDAEIRNRPALEMIDYYRSPDCLIYADPPYVLSTRLADRHYSHEMSDADHIAMLQALKAHTGPAVLSGYDHPMYSEYLSSWHKVTTQALIEHAHTRTECLWLNPRAASSVQPELWQEQEASA